MSLAQNHKFVFATIGQLCMASMFNFTFCLINPILISYYGLSIEKATLILLCSGPLYILCAPIAFKLLDRKIVKRRLIIYINLITYGVCMMFGTGQFHLINNKDKIWVLIVCLAIGGGSNAFVATTAFPEIVDQAETAMVDKNFHKQEMNVYLSSLFNFILSVSQIIGPFSSNLLAEYLGYRNA